MVQCCRCPAWQCQADGGSSASIVNEYDGRLSNITFTADHDQLPLHSRRCQMFHNIRGCSTCITGTVVMYPKAPERGLARKSIRCRLRNSTGSSGTRESSLRSSRILILLT